MAPKPDTPWFDRIKKSGQLSVFPGSSLAKGPWAALFPKAIAEFNRLASQLKLAVTLIPATDAPDEDENSFGGADVRFEIGDMFEFKAAGQKTTITLGPLEKGHTQTLSWDFGKGPQIRKACVLMKANPLADDYPRRVGDGVLLCFAVHEFIHALGLHEHTPGGGDLLQDIPALRTGGRNSPGDDKLEVIGNKRLPPLFLLGTTVNRIQALWPSP
jgi:hypothetical protein